MAKLRGAAKVAFLRRMAAGRRKASKRTRHYRQKRYTARLVKTMNRYNPRRRRPGRVRFVNPAAIIANPFYGYGRPRRRRKRKGVKTMARRRRSSSKRRNRRRHVTRTAPRRRRSARRRNPKRRRKHRHWGGVTAHSRRVNPRRRRRSHRRRNPGMGGLLRRVFVPYATGFVTSIGASMIDAGLANYPIVQRISKVGLAFAIAFAGRRYPTASTAAIASLAASEGYPLGTKLAGGLVAHTPAQAVKGLGEMSQTYPEIGALLNGGVGALLNGMGAPPDMPNVVRDYQTAIANMAGDDD